MKKRILSLLCVALLVSVLLPPASALEGEAARAADTLFTLGLLQEGETVTDTPADRVTAALLIVRLAGSSPAAEPVSPFQDVPDWAAGAVNRAFQQGWVAGISPDTFAPYQPVNARTWYTMLLRMLGYRDSAGDFAFSDAESFARRIGLTSRSYADTLTRGDLFESALDTLRFPYKDGSGTVLSRLTAQGACNPAVVNALGLSRRELTVREAADRHMAAVFCLSLYGTAEAAAVGESTDGASGFFITKGGVAVTNYHSIQGAVRAVATLVTGESYEVERVLWYDVDMDLAVIRVSRTSLTQKVTSAFSYLEIAGVQDARPGDIVYAIGNPLGMGLAVSSGVISATNRAVEQLGFPCILNTAPISHGSSGGPLINVYGHVLAVTSATFPYGNSMYIAIPADIIKSIDTTVPGQTLPEVAQTQISPPEADLGE